MFQWGGIRRKDPNEGEAMRPLERVPAVRRIETDNHATFAFDLAGEFTGADAENLFGLLEGAYAISNRLDVLVRTTMLERIDFDEFDTQTKQELRAHLDNHVARIAIIDDGQWASAIERLLKPDGSIEVRRYDPGEEQEAWAWIGAQAIPDDI